jgi:cytochrome c-type biogenesis protein
VEVQPSQLNVLIALLGGVLSFLSPCVLPLVPGYLSFVSGFSVESLRSGQSNLKRSGRLIWQTLLFILGFTVVFMLLGGVVGGLSEWFFAYRRGLEIVAGALIIFFGIFLTGIYRPALLEREFRPTTDNGGSGAASFFVGASFGFGWTPCVGPILGAILALAGTGGDATRGAMLLGVYSLGLGIPFVLTALLFDYALGWFEAAKRWLHWLERLGGAILIVAGILIVSGQFERLAGLLTEMFPVLLTFG